MKKRILIVSLVLVLTIIIGTSCDLMDQYNEMQSQNQLQTYEKPTTTSTTPKQTDPSNDNNNPNPDDTQNPGGSDGEQREELKAPDFTVYDADGNAVKLSNFFGKPIVLNFWASWCGLCQFEMPDFNKKYLELGDEIQFLMINLTGGRETVEGAQSFINNKGYSFPVFFDTSYSASNAYSVYSIPATYFIDANGYMIANAIGAISEATLQQGIDLIK